jgi:hypothetical protein
MDILGPFPMADGGYNYLFVYVAIDKFIKWLQAVKFIKSIVYRFGVPNRIITD